MQASAAATLDGSPVVVVVCEPGAGAGFAGGTGVGLTGSVMLHLEERRCILSRQLGRFSLSRAGERRYARLVSNPIRVRAGDKTYDVVVGSRLLGEAAGLIREKLDARTCAVISDDNVARHFADPIVES